MRLNAYSTLEAKELNNQRKIVIVIVAIPTVTVEIGEFNHEPQMND